MTSGSISLVLKVTHECNLECSYCDYIHSLPKVDVKSNLSINDLENILIKTAQSYKDISLIFHGGEPLILPISYYENVIRIQHDITRNYNVIFSNSIQTNGTLLSQSIIDFLKSNNIHIGISLDGPKNIHDKNRPFIKSNQSSFDIIIKNINILKNNGINVSTLIVATKDVIKNPYGLYSFYKKNDLSFKINELFPKYTMQEFIPTNKELGSFYKKLFYIWINDKKEPILTIQPFVSIIIGLWEGNIGDCTYNSNCSSFFIIETDGAVNVCSRLIDKSYSLGNIIHQDWKEIHESELLKQLSKRKKMLPKDCNNCKWIELCYGGCPACVSDSAQDLYQKTIWCKSREMMFEAIHAKITSIKLEEEK